MLWTLLKIVIFLGIVVAGTWGTGFLLEADGGIRVSVAGTEYTLGALESVIALVLLMVASWLLFKIVGLVVAFVRFALGDKTAINRFFDRRRERRGYDALAEGMMALASGESSVALSKAAKADLGADARDWSAEKSDPALIAHVKDRVDHYLSPNAIARMTNEWRSRS